MAYVFVTSHYIDKNFHGFYSGYGSVDGVYRFTFDEYYDASTNRTRIIGYTQVKADREWNAGTYGKLSFSGGGQSNSCTYANTGRLSYSFTQLGGSSSIEFSNDVNGSGKTISVNVYGGAEVGYSYFGNTYGLDVNGVIIGINAFSSSFNTTSHPSYTLTVDNNNGDPAISFSHQQGYAQTIATPVKTGYTFNGWTLSGGGSISGSIYTYGNSNGTLTANWIPAEYTLTINGDEHSTISVLKNGEVLSDGDTIYYGDTITVNISSDAGYQIETRFPESNGDVIVTENLIIRATTSPMATIHRRENGSWETYLIHIRRNRQWQLHQANVRENHQWIKYF